MEKRHETKKVLGGETLQNYLYFKAKNDIFIPVESMWIKVYKGERVLGNNVDGIVTLYLKQGTKNESIALFKISDVMRNFDIA